MKFVCKNHGEVENEPNLNFDVFCPKCLQKWYSEYVLTDTISPLSTKSKEDESEIFKKGRDSKIRRVIRVWSKAE